MELHYVSRSVLGVVLLAASQALQLFSLFRGVEWLQKNQPTAFAILDNTALQYTLLIAGLGMSAWGLLGYLASRKRPIGEPPTTPAIASVSALAATHGAHSPVITLGSGVVNNLYQAAPPVAPHVMLEFRNPPQQPSGLYFTNVSDEPIYQVKGNYEQRPLGHALINVDITKMEWIDAHDTDLMHCSLIVLIPDPIRVFRLALSPCDVGALRVEITRLLLECLTDGNNNVTVPVGITYQDKLGNRHSMRWIIEIDRDRVPKVLQPH
ncbi:MAG: hypothetical protein ACKV22_40960 [Bryobacteraceae bacterium]